MSREAMKQPEALRLADALDELDRQFSRNGLCGDAAAELRRLHEVNQDLLEALHEALETEQEPVAFINVEKQKLEWAKLTSWHTPTIVNLPKIPLYTAPPKREWVGLTDEEIDALSQARSLTDELMDCVDRLGSEADTVDPRVWQHLLVYAPKPEEEPVAWITNGGKGELWWHRSSKFDEEGNLIGPNQDDIPLYTAPPKKEWIGLTDEEVSYCRYAATFCDELDTAYMAELIEQALKEKNT